MLFARLSDLQSNGWVLPFHARNGADAAQTISREEIQRSEAARGQPCVWSGRLRARDAALRHVYLFTPYSGYLLRLLLFDLPPGLFNRSAALTLLDSGYHVSTLSFPFLTLAAIRSAVCGRNASYGRVRSIENKTHSLDRSRVLRENEPQAIEAVEALFSGTSYSVSFEWQRNSFSNGVTGAALKVTF